ncbi:hypothetical protein HDU76_007475, partial [Blyttiomyces sp. JEL0837]
MKIAWWLKCNIEGDIVGLYMGRERLLFPTIYGCWLAGKSVAIFSLSWPRKLLETIAARLQISTLVADRYPPSAFPFVVLSHVLDSRNMVANVEFEFAGLKGPKVAWTMHTSGTTGTPKSVAIPMTSVTSNAKNYVHAYSSLRNSKFPVTSSPTFLSTHFLAGWSPFLRCNLILPDPTKIDESDFLRSASNAAQVLVETLNGGATKADFTPTLLKCVNSIMELSGISGWHQVNLCRIFGERVTTNDFVIMRRMFPNANLMAIWGMTETFSVMMKTATIKPNDEIPKEVTYVPFSESGSQWCLVDNEMNKLARIPGQVGKIAFVGIESCGAAGYIGCDKDDTFLSLKGGERAIISADLGRIAEDGSLFVLGRSGRKIKINGVFIDLDALTDELSTALQKYGVSKLAVVDCVWNPAEESTTHIVLVAEQPRHISNTSGTVLSEGNGLLKLAQTTLQSAGVQTSLNHAFWVDSMPETSSAKVSISAVQMIAKDRLSQYFATACNPQQRTSQLSPPQFSNSKTKKDVRNFNNVSNSMNSANVTGVGTLERGSLPYQISKLIAFKARCPSRTGEDFRLMRLGLPKA